MRYHFKHLFNALFYTVTGIRQTLKFLIAYNTFAWNEQIEVCVSYAGAFFFHIQSPFLVLFLQRQGTRKHAWFYLIRITLPGE